MSHDEAPSPDINSVWIIRKPMPEEQALLASLLLKSVRDTWRKNGLELEHSDFQDEMHSRLECLSRFFSGESDIVDIRIIEEDPPGKIRGLAALYPPGKTMIRNLQSRLDASHAELGCFTSIRSITAGSGAGAVRIYEPPRGPTVTVAAGPRFRLSQQPAILEQDSR